MKKFFLITFLLLLSTLSFGKMVAVSKYQVKDVGGVTISLTENKPFTGMVTDGKDREFYIKGKPDGKWISFHSNGKIKTIENWKEGMLDGKFIIYNDKGKKYWKHIIPTELITENMLYIMQTESHIL